MVKNRIIVLVFIIGTVVMLLVLNFFLLKKNSSIIDQNKEALQNATAVKVKMTEVISNLHLLDLGIRGYALVENKQIESSYDTAIERWQSIHAQLENALHIQGFPLAKINLLKDTVSAYVNWIAVINEMIDQGKRKEAIEMINRDKGYDVWRFHKQLSNEINAFENKIASEATTKYQTALRNSYVLQLILFLLIVPTLIYLAYFTIRSFRLTEKLLESEAEKNKILFNQNEELERQVCERTQEIAAQNEEIISQNEEIQAHNEKLLAQQIEIEKQSELLKSRNKQLENANDLIARQKQIIESENLQLTSDLDRQNKELLQSNYELVQRNNRIEQFAYMISHNLRAPIARLTGLANIFKFANSKSEFDDLVDKTKKSADELDQVVRGLSEIMQVQRMSSEVFREIQLDKVLDKTMSVLEKEIQEMEVAFKVHFEVNSFYSLPPYIESIFYNLISNGIKYRHPKRKPLIIISSKMIENSLCLEFADNGMGIDLDSHKENIFGLYKRFHFHVDGRGIGLYLVKSQVEMIGGKISVFSIPDQGTTFKISLPIVARD